MRYDRISNMYLGRAPYKLIENQFKKFSMKITCFNELILFTKRGITQCTKTYRGSIPVGGNEVNLSLRHSVQIGSGAQRTPYQRGIRCCFPED